LWTGAQDNNWYNCTNWSDGRVPNSSTDVLMNESAANDIQISGTASCRSITMQTLSGLGTKQITLLPNASLQIINDLVISNTSTTGSLKFKLSPNTSITCRNLTISGSSAGSQNATFESFPNTVSVEVNGNLIISSGGRLKLSDGNNATIDGLLKLKGNFINNGSLADVDLGNSKIILNGISAQTINCPANTSLWDLDINNTSGVPIVINNNLQINRLLNLQNGKLDLNGRIIRLGTNTMPATVTGGNANSYIISWDGADNGTIIHNVPSNTSSYLFPMGDLNEYTPFEVILNGGTLSSATLTGKLRPMSHPDLGVASNYLNRYWIIEQTGISNPLYDVVYGYAPNDVVGTDAFIFPAKHNDLGWQSSNESGANAMIGNGDVNTASRTIAWSGITTFSDFTGVGSGTALPVSLLNFDGKCDDGEVSFHWATASEINNHYFTIEESETGANWYEMHKENGHGNTNNYISYDIQFKPRYNGGSYFRLKQVDFNGETTLYDPIYVTCKNSDNLVTILPNPVSDLAKVNIKASSNFEMQMNLFSSSGQIIFSRNIQVRQGENEFGLDVSALPAGAYHLQMSTKENVTISGNKTMIKR